MQQKLKERLVGASVISFFMVIFIPMILDGRSIDKHTIDIDDSPNAGVKLILPKLPAEQSVKEPTVDIKLPSQAKPEATISSPSEPKQPDDNKQQSVEQKNATSDSSKLFMIQIASFSELKKSQELTKKLKQAGYKAFMKSSKVAGKTFYRVRIGPESSRSNALLIRNQIKQKIGLNGILLPHP